MNFKNICRTCSLEGDLKSLFICLVSVGNTLLISDMLNDITHIKAKKDDNYPQNICTYCLDKLKLAYLFKKQCQEVHQKFENYFKTNENVTHSFNAENLFSCSNVEHENVLKLPLEYVKDEDLSTLPELIIQDSLEDNDGNITLIKDESIAIEEPRLEVIIRDEIFEENYSWHSSDSESNHQTSLIQENNENQFSCDICEKSYNRKTNLLRHKRIHNDENLHSCDICCKKFSARCNLIRHIRIHTGEKPYLCDFCNKTFVDQAGFIRHKRIHTGEKPFSCDICHKTFTQRGHAKEHKRIHTGERPYSCHICHKKFTQRSHLNDHIRIHTGKKPFACDVCNKLFNSNYNLGRHKRIHN